MTGALHDYRWIWRVTTTQRDPKSLLVIRYLMLAVLSVVVVVAAGLIVGGKMDAEGIGLLVRTLLGLGSFWFGIVWAMLFVPASIVMNSPANARTMPGQRRRLMQMAAAGWALETAAFGAALGSWAAVPIVGGYLLGFCLLRAGSAYGGVPVFLACLWPILSRHVLPPALVDGLTTVPGLLLLGVLLLPAGGWTLRWLYPAGGDAHLEQRGERIKRMQRWESKGLWTPGELGGLSRWSRRQVYEAALRRDCGRPRAGAMLMHALGPVAHWSSWLAGLAVILAFGIGVRLLLSWRGGPALHDFAQGAAAAGFGGMVIAVLFVTAQFGQQIRNTRGEQALLRMTPLAGDAALLNRRLAVGLLKGALRNWTLTTAVILAVSALIGEPGALVSQLASCCLAGQVAMFGLLGDYAERGGWSPSRVLWSGLLAVLETMLALGLGWATGTAPWWWMAGIAVAGSGVQLRHSWRRMLAAPPAFPAGRMA
jgi:hypothetical protein